ncbi:MAG: hypothetical protein HY903_16765 [Deltaproteobacteria bacterium]|nr:hypothetical protein [Deltaproteobacteria bacterium]
MTRTILRPNGRLLFDSGAVLVLCGFVGCGQGDPAETCGGAAHCRLQEGVPTCEAGYTWADPSDPYDLRCVLATTAACHTSTLSELCCPQLGIDACGAGLFCAAFDGRTVATCYPEGARQAGEACLENRHCASGGCAASGVCQSVPFQSCSPDVGCHNPQGALEIWICAEQSNQCIKGGVAVGGHCGEDAVCASGRCADATCVSGERGDRCVDNADCASGNCGGLSTCELPLCRSAADCDTAGGCVGGRCTDGAAHDPCVNNDDCAAPLTCHDRYCSYGQVGDPCTVDHQCSQGCLGGQCVAQALGAACDSDPDCTAGSCLSGVCSVPCGLSLDCLLYSLFSVGYLECRDAQCRSVGGVGDACTVDPDCATDTGGLRCAPGGTCLLTAGRLCSGGADCLSGVCAAVDVMLCRDPTTHVSAGACVYNNDCDPNEYCAHEIQNKCGP